MMEEYEQAAEKLIKDQGITFIDEGDGLVFEIIDAMTKGYNPNDKPSDEKLKGLGFDDFRDYISDINNNRYCALEGSQSDYLKTEHEPNDDLGQKLVLELNRRSFLPSEKGLATKYFVSDFKNSIKFANDYFDKLPNLDLDSDEISNYFENASRLLDRAEQDLNTMKRIRPVTNSEDFTVKGDGMYSPWIADIRTLKGKREEFKEFGPHVEEMKDLMVEMSKAINEEKFEIAAQYRDKIDSLKSKFSE